MRALRIGVWRDRYFFPLFVLTTFAVLFFPVDGPVTILRHRLHIPFYSSDIHVPLAVGFVAWGFCIFCLILMWRIASSENSDLPLVLTRYVLFALVVLLAVERFVRAAALDVQLNHTSRSMSWIQMLSAIVVALGASSLSLRLQNLKESAALGQKEHARFLASAESSLDDFYIFDGVPDATGQIVDFRFSYINPNAERRLNTKREKLLGKILTEVRPFMVSSGLIEKYREVVRTGQPLTCEVFIDDEMIKATWLNVQVVKLGDGIAITSRDVTESKRLADHVHFLAHYDQLTGLANRTLLQDRLHQAILRARRYRHKVALFVLDVDHFKQINDSLGHADGDALLSIVGERLVSVVRETDTVARMGGDEFVIVMPDFKTIDDVRRCASLIVESTARPIKIGNHMIHITVSVGVCTFPDYADNTGDLFKNADAAMYVVKQTGRNGLHLFDGHLMKEKQGNLAET